MATLADLPLGQRVAAARQVIESELGLSTEQRGELLGAALWPRPTRIYERTAPVVPEPKPAPRVTTPADRAWARELRADGVTCTRIAELVGVHPPNTVMRWLRESTTTSGG